MPALPPIKPKSSSGSRGTTSKGRPTSKSASPRQPAGPPPIPTLSPNVANNINNDEAAQRHTILESEMIAYTALTAWRNDEVLLGVQLQTERTTAVVSRLDKSLDAHTTSSESVASTLNTLTNSTESLHTQLKNFLEWQSSSDATRLKELEQECYHLKELLRQTEDANAKLRAENIGLRQTISRKLVDAEAQFEASKREVTARLEQEKIDFDVFRRSVFQRIDAAVLQYHRPQFEGAVEGLRDHLKEVERSVAAHTARLVLIAESVGSNTSIPDVKSMHSQLPERLRSQLRNFNKDSLLSLIDVLSFEAGVTTAVASAVAASTTYETQNVFS